jgi:hypothetical protein
MRRLLRRSSSPYVLAVIVATLAMILAACGGNGRSVTHPSAQPTATLTANPNAVAAGQPTTLAWSCTNASSCVGSGFDTGGRMSGTVNVSPSQTTTYGLTATDSGGSAQTSAMVTVNSALAPPSPSAPYIVGFGTTIRNNFPVTDGSIYKNNPNGAAWAAVFTIFGFPTSSTSLIKSTYLVTGAGGGSVAGAENRAMWIDNRPIVGNGDIYVGGKVSDAWVNTTAGVIQPTYTCHSGKEIGYLEHFDYAGNTKAATYFGLCGTSSQGFGWVFSIAGIGPNGDLIFTGHGQCLTDNKIAGVTIKKLAANCVQGSPALAFAASISTDFKTLNWVTTFSGGAADNGTESAGRGRSILDSNGNIYGQGSIHGPGFPTTSGAYQTTCSNPVVCGVVWKLHHDGSSFDWATYLGGSGAGGRTTTTIEGVALDSSNNLYVVSFSDDADAVPGDSCSGGYQSTPPDPNNPQGLITLFNSTGTAILHCTWLNGKSKFTNFGDQTNGIALAPDGSVFVYGGTTSDTYPTTSGAFMTTKPSIAGDLRFTSGVVTHLDANLTTILASSYIGGSPPTGSAGAGEKLQEQSGSIVFDRSSSTAPNVCFNLPSNDQATGGGKSFPTTANAYARSYPGSQTDPSMMIVCMNYELTSEYYGTYFSQGTSNGTTGQDSGGNGNTWGQIGLDFGPEQ